MMKNTWSLLVSIFLKLLVPLLIYANDTYYQYNSGIFVSTISGKTCGIDSPYHPYGVVVDPTQQFLYFVTSYADKAHENSSSLLWKLTISSGAASTIALDTPLSNILGLTCDHSGNLYVSQSFAIHYLPASAASTPDSSFTLVAGSSMSGDITGVGLLSRFKDVYSLVLNADDSFVYFTDCGNYKIKRMSTLFPYNTSIFVNMTESPRSITMNSDTVCVSVGYSSIKCGKIAKYPAVDMTLLAGSAYGNHRRSCLSARSIIYGCVDARHVDGSLEATRFSKIHSIRFISSSGDMIIADANTVRHLGKSFMTTLAGSGTIPSTSVLTCDNWSRIRGICGRLQFFREIQRDVVYRNSRTRHIRR